MPDDIIVAVAAVDGCVIGIIADVDCVVAVARDYGSALSAREGDSAAVVNVVVAVKCLNRDVVAVVINGVIALARIDQNFIAAIIGKIVIAVAAVDCDFVAAYDVVRSAVRIKSRAAVLDGVIAFAAVEYGRSDRAVVEKSVVARLAV